MSDDAATPDTETAEPGDPLDDLSSDIGWWFGGALVLLASAIVLVTEIVAARVIAPYVGITLETFSAVIGCVLAGISLGSGLGGWLADRIAARWLLAAALAVGGAALIASPHIVTSVGPGVTPSNPSGALTLAVSAFLLPSIALSMVTPTILRSIGQGSRRLGSVAGSVSAIGTIGALLGNFGASFILVGAMRSAQILVFCGVVCLVLAAAAILVLGGDGPPQAVAAFLLVGAALGGTQVDDNLPCLVETEYVCLNVDQINDQTFEIRSNIYSSSVTNVADPTALEFTYVRDVAAVAAATLADDAPAFGYVGGGGYTLPLYFEATYPGSTHVVYEIDGEMVDEVTSTLGIDDRARRFPTRIGDARAEVATSDEDSMDLVVGDAFLRHLRALAPDDP